IYSTKDDKYYRENPYDSIDVVDRIGSGDAYVSGALYGYLKHNDCQKALEYGNAMAAIKHSVIGDMISTDIEEINSIIAQHQDTSEFQMEMNR
ncbi:MAG: sugar kinase, partial [Lachnospiraceae bacterium]|nr:sugar kinase [Lachnospiraceae bacterium]